MYFYPSEMTDFSTIQDMICADLVERMPISAFIHKSDANNYLVKNTVGVKCPKCHSENVNAFSKQVRSGDEAMTIFYTCLDCKNKWRVG
jgi:DNA-directed RNA polymerase subunit M/transcription elongation factor TFIIS